jgi:hypothetical protein
MVLPGGRGNCGWGSGQLIYGDACVGVVVQADTPHRRSTTNSKVLATSPGHDGRWWPAPDGGHELRFPAKVALVGLVTTTRGGRRRLRG